MNTIQVDNVSFLSYVNSLDASIALLNVTIAPLPSFSCVSKVMDEYCELYMDLKDALALYKALITRDKLKVADVGIAVKDMDGSFSYSSVLNN